MRLFACLALALAACGRPAPEAPAPVVPGPVLREVALGPEAAPPAPTAAAALGDGDAAWLHFVAAGPGRARVVRMDAGRRLVTADDGVVELAEGPNALGPWPLAGDEGGLVLVLRAEPLGDAELARLLPEAQAAAAEMAGRPFHDAWAAALARLAAEPGVLPVGARYGPGAF